MKIRLMGTPAECQAALEAIRTSLRLDVVEISPEYANRGDSLLVRVYVDAPSQ
jgi:hypothetical protein